MLHPGAWWGWAVALGAAAGRTTNPLLLGLVVAVTALVVSSRRSTAPWARSFGTLLRVGLVIIAFRIALEIFFGMRIPGTTLFTLPEVDLPEWVAGLSLGGPVTAEALCRAATEGLRLAAILACFGAANSLASPFRLLRCLPAVLYEAGVAVTVALSLTPQLATEARRVHEARRLRGRPTSGLAGARGIVVPVLEGALDRSVHLAASMDTRGYGRRRALPPAARRAVTVGTSVGLGAVIVGIYGMLDAGAPGALGLPVLAVGSLLAASGLMVQGRRATRSRYRPDPWRWPEWVTIASGIAALAGVVTSGAANPLSLQMPLSPLAWPGLPVAATIGVLVAALPAWATPVPPDRLVAAEVGAA